MMQVLRINLLPYRQMQQQAKRQRCERHLMLAFCSGVVALLACVLLQHIHDERQDQRLHLLQNEHALLDQQIQQQSQLQKEIAELNTELQELAHLQQQRFQIVHLLSELARHVPPEIRLQTVRQKSDQLSLHGTATAHQDISNLLENLNQSAMLSAAQLQHTTKTGDRQDFLITVTAP
jgi:type IV pilus assembly protein PilN